MQIEQKVVTEESTQALHCPHPFHGLHSFFFPFLFSFFFRDVPEAYGGSQAMEPTGAAAAGLHHSHSHTGSEPHLRSTPQLTATPDP